MTLVCDFAFFQPLRGKGHQNSVSGCKSRLDLCRLSRFQVAFSILPIDSTDPRAEGSRGKVAFEEYVEVANAERVEDLEL